jgi:16S rRNA C967 or C1407 C5-methylase (RsmB/RsmF family)
MSRARRQGNRGRQANPDREEQFERFYAELFPQRWPALRRALTQEPHYTALEQGLLQPYYLDEASYHAARALDPQPGEEILDMCAAPGGKCLSLLSLQPAIRMTANERSSRRRGRLKRVLEEHLPEERFRELRITGHDAARWSQYEEAAYDRILLDVPCSSERHIYTSPAHLQQWSPARSRHLAVQAFAMLASALEVVRPGGLILYSTCALAPQENDGVIAKLFRKRAGRFELQETRLPFGEPTRYGWQVLPDTAEGRGPIYCARLRRYHEEFPDDSKGEHR